MIGTIDVPAKEVTSEDRRNIIDLRVTFDMA
jgi:hypothetical protein